MKNCFKLLALIVVMTIMFAGCGNNNTVNTPAESGSEENVLNNQTESSDEVSENNPAYRWTLVTSVSGLGDQSFNDISYKGLLEAAEVFGGEVNVIESKELAQLVPNLTAAARTEPTLIVGVGFDFVDAITEVAAQYPEVNFAIVDAEVDLPNVASILFSEQEGSFLGGIMAGLMTETGTVGYIGGQEFPPVLRWQAGFMAGVKTANPDVEILTTYAGTWADPVKGREAALAMYNNGADIIFEVAGGTALGVYEVAQELDGSKWVFGPDVCKHQLAPDNTLPNVTKNVDVALLAVAEEIASGQFQGGTKSSGLADGGMGLCMERFEELLPEEVIAKMEAAKELVVNGEIEIPTTPEDVAHFVAPDF